MSISKFATLCLAAVVSAAAVPASAATTFSFLFDNSGGGPDGTIGTPLVGGGTFVSPISLGVGQYALTSLPGFSLQFTFGSETFSTADIATPLSDVAVAISATGSGERLVFTENGSGDGGPFGGSLDLVNSQGDQLSFEPSFAGGNDRYFEFGSGFNFGNYLALASVPEPATWAMLILGLGGLGVALRRRQVVAA